tara:strand:+ start:1381 stop:3654 length:2274 start_codon:yes stop_codon:yes gene_type:complete
MNKYLYIYIMPPKKQTKRKRSPSPTSSSSSSDAGLDVNNIGYDLDYNEYKERVEKLASTTLGIEEFGVEIKSLKVKLYQILQKYSEDLGKKEKVSSSSKKKSKKQSTVTEHDDDDVSLTKEDNDYITLLRKLIDEVILETYKKIFKQKFNFEPDLGNVFTSKSIYIKKIKSKITITNKDFYVLITNLLDIIYILQKHYIKVLENYEKIVNASILYDNLKNLINSLDKMSGMRDENDKQINFYFQEEQKKLNPLVAKNKLIFVLSTASMCEDKGERGKRSKFEGEGGEKYCFYCGKQWGKGAQCDHIISAHRMICCYYPIKGDEGGLANNFGKSHAGCNNQASEMDPITKLLVSTSQIFTLYSGIMDVKTDSNLDPTFNKMDRTREVMEKRYKVLNELVKEDLKEIFEPFEYRLAASIINESVSTVPKIKLSPNLTLANLPFSEIIEKTGLQKILDDLNIVASADKFLPVLIDKFKKNKKDKVFQEIEGISNKMIRDRLTQILTTLQPVKNCDQQSEAAFVLTIKRIMNDDLSKEEDKFILEVMIKKAIECGSSDPIIKAAQERLALVSSSAASSSAASSSVPALSMLQQYNSDAESDSGSDAESEPTLGGKARSLSYYNRMNKSKANSKVNSFSNKSILKLDIKGKIMLIPINNVLLVGKTVDGIFQGLEDQEEKEKVYNYLNNFFDKKTDKIKLSKSISKSNLALSKKRIKQTKQKMGRMYTIYEDKENMGLNIKSRGKKRKTKKKEGKKENKKRK